MLEVKWAEIYGLESAKIFSGLPMKKDNEIEELEEQLLKDFVHSSDENRIKKLSKVDIGTGHDCALKGITVHMLIKAPLYFWKQWDRYHFQDTVSSTSTMHKILEENLNDVLPDNVFESTKTRLRAEINLYREFKSEDTFNTIIANLPQGYLYTRAVVTNYLQLKTMYQQRKNHKLKERHRLFDVLKLFPDSRLFTRKVF